MPHSNHPTNHPKKLVSVSAVTIEMMAENWPLV